MVKLSAGSFDLNKWMHGGYDSDIITTIYGSAGTGKTNFCLLAAVSQAKKGKKVVFIDTEGGFSSERVKQILGSDEDWKDILKNIFILKPTNFKEQKDAFKELLKHLKKQISLIVVDGMTMLYRLDFADARERDAEIGTGGNGEIKKINAELVRQLRTLAEISRKQRIPILVTNQTYSWEDERKMVAGDILKYWSKCLIELENEGGRRTAYLKKHRSLPEKSLTFQIWSGGVRKRGWI
jgi:DNA repair protein RadB